MPVKWSGPTMTRNLWVKMKIKNVGQHACGTVSLSKGLMQLKNKSKELLHWQVATNTKGMWAFCCHTAMQLGAFIWVDSSASDKMTCNFLSTFRVHSP